MRLYIRYNDIMETQYIALIVLCCLCMYSSCSVIAYFLLQKKEKTEEPMQYSKDPEVFYVGPYSYTKEEAAGVCSSRGATVATMQQLRDAFAAGADWCTTGWVADDAEAYYPINTTITSSCATERKIVQMTPVNKKAGVHCYGKKPMTAGGSIAPFNISKWSMSE